MCLNAEHYEEPYVKIISQKNKKEIHSEPWWNMGLSKWVQQKEVYLSSKTKRKHLLSWFFQCKESFSKRFIIVTGFSYRRKLKMKKRGGNVKFNSKYYRDKVLTSIFTEEIPFLYLGDFHAFKLHQGTEWSRTSKIPLHS